MMRVLLLPLLLAGCQTWDTSYAIDRAVWASDAAGRTPCVHYADEARRILGDVEQYVVSGPYPGWQQSDDWHLITCVSPVECYDNMHTGSTRLSSWDVVMTYEEYQRD